MIYEQIIACVENGVNVITSCEDAEYPWDLPTADLSRKIDAIAKTTGATVIGSGSQEMYANPLLGMDIPHLQS